MWEQNCSHMVSERMAELSFANVRPTPWRLGLVLAALVWLGAPAANQAEEAPHQVNTALSSTTLSGYIDTSAIWQIGYYYEPVPPLISKNDVGNIFLGGDISTAPVIARGSGQPDFFGPSGTTLEQVPEPSSIALGALAVAMVIGRQVRHRRKNG